MELLSGWKEIAEYLHLTVRTSQRWERLGLPVRRVSDSPCSPVVAIPDELELWARTRDVRSDAALIPTNKLLSTRMAELRQAQVRIKRKTRGLLRQIDVLGKQQTQLVAGIRANLCPPRNAPPRNYRVD
jgi:hypothetical protein